MGSAVRRASAVVAAINDALAPTKPGVKEVVAILEALAEEWEEPVVAFLKKGEDSEIAINSDEWEEFVDALPDAVQEAR